MLLTGKPIYVDGHHRPGKIEDSAETVDGIVRDPAHGYVAAIGGDIHNYQRYPVSLPDGRSSSTSSAVVAARSCTRPTRFRAIATCPACSEDDFRCYPLRGDSLAAYSILLNRWIPGYDVVVPPEVAPALMSLRLKNLDPTRAEDQDEKVPKDAWRKASIVFPISHAKILGPLNTYFSEILDWNKPPPPLFKSFLRVDTRPGEVELRCFGATGCKEHADDPPLEDWIKGTRGGDGVWTWEVLLD